jgi:hypothetical protein
MPSAISTPTFAAQNASILNDGSADSPRGFGNVTTAGPHSFTVSKTGPSLYNVSCNAASGAITATLPNDVKAGYRVRFEVTLTNSTEANSFFTSPAIAEAQINGTGFVELMALVDNPSTAGNWKVTDVEERSAALTATATGANTSTVNYSFVRQSKQVTFSAYQAFMAAIGTNARITMAAVPTRIRPSAQQYIAWSIAQNSTGFTMGLLEVVTSGAFSAINVGLANYTGSCGFSGSNGQGSIATYII